MTQIETQSASAVFMNLVVAFLTPMFLSVADGDIAYARAAAVETINAYRAQNHSDLLSVAQIIAFGLAALGSLGLAMADDLSISLTIRLRASAVASNRAGEISRRALAQARSHAALPPEPQRDDEFSDEAAIAAGMEQVRKHAAEAKARLQVAQPAPQPTALASADDAHRSTSWANAMADVAAEFAADLRSLPPAERKAASVQAAALSRAASDLLVGTDGQLPPSFNLRHPSRPG